MSFASKLPLDLEPFDGDIEQVSILRVEGFFITNSLTGGGAERASNILCNFLHDSGTPIALVPVNKGENDLIDLKCDVIGLERDWGDGFFSVLRAWFKLQSMIFRLRPKYLVLNCDLPELLGCLSLPGPKLVVVEHASQPWPNKKSFGHLVRRILKFRSAYWVAVSENLQIWGLNLTPDSVIQNPISLTTYCELSNNVKYKDLDFEKRLVFIGRLNEVKQPQWVLEIANKVNLPCLIIGGGPLEQHLKRFASSLRIESEFLGHVKNVWENLTKNDLLLVTSKNEGDGLVIVEAIVNQVPFLLLRVPDLERFQLPDTFYCTDINEFENKIKLFFSNHLHLKLPDSYRDSLLQNRSPQLIAKKWNDLLSQFR